MKPSVVSDILAVGEVPSPEQLEILAKAGFKSVINCQPDGEVERFATSAVLKAEATRQGLGYVYAPIVSRTPSDDELEVLQHALEHLPAPVYAFCYSGSRSAAAAAYLQTSTAEPDQIIREYADAGFDIGGLKPWLDDERKRRTGGVAKAGLASGRTAPLGSAGPAGSVSPVAVPLPAALALKGIVVHARAAGFSGFAVAG